MKKLSLLFLFVITNLTAFNQIIKGTILEKETNNTICFATIYFNGTFGGTSSDQNGNFELDISKYRSMPLTISAIGYYSVTITEFSRTKSLTVYLQPKIYELNEAIISAKSLEKKRRKNLLLFKEEFIGTTANAQECVIMNEKDITFNYYSDDDTIKAYAFNPIVIENKSLGYRITYYLDKFEYYKEKEATFFCGNIIFNEDLIVNDTPKQFYEKRRESVYFGSRMHFFRVLWSGNLKSSGFIIKNPELKVLKLKDIVFEDDKSNKFLKYPSNLFIEYNHRKSIIEFLKEDVYFDETGFFNPGIIWKGEMSKQRIADWLPYEYLLNNNNL